MCSRHPGELDIEIPVTQVFWKLFQDKKYFEITAKSSCVSHQQIYSKSNNKDHLKIHYPDDILYCMALFASCKNRTPYCSTVTWLSWCLKTTATPLFLQQLVHANNRENIVSSHCWTFVMGVSTNDQWIPLAGRIGASAWWRHQMETFSALLAICAGNSPVPGELPTQRPVTRSFDVYFDLRPNKWLSKQSWGWWFETLSCSLWRHRNGHGKHFHVLAPSWDLELAVFIFRLNESSVLLESRDLWHIATMYTTI